LATALIRPGGHVANVGVHGRPAKLHLEALWTRDVTITTGLVDTSTIPQLMALVTDGRLDPSAFATHHFALDETMAAYDTFAAAATSDGPHRHQADRLHGRKGSRRRRRLIGESRRGTEATYGGRSVLPADDRRRGHS
jgi:hypothetical protein